jgi:hypothetical protein
MLKKCLFLLLFLSVSAGLFAQLSCPNFKIRGNKSPRSNPFTTAIKFQFDGITQYQGIAPKYGQRLIFYPALMVGLEQTLHQKLSVSAIHGWTLNSKNYNSRTLLGDVRYYFDQCFEGKWLSARITLADSYTTENAQFQPFISLHYGKTVRSKFIFTHYEMGIGFGKRETIVISFGAATGLKLN